VVVGQRHWGGLQATGGHSPRTGPHSPRAPHSPHRAVKADTTAFLNDNRGEGVEPPAAKKAACWKKGCWLVPPSHPHPLAIDSIFSPKRGRWEEGGGEGGTGEKMMGGLHLLAGQDTLPLGGGCPLPLKRPWRPRLSSKPSDIKHPSHTKDQT